MNEFGTILYDCWFYLENHNHNLRLDKIVLIPNNFHGIMIIDNKNNNDNGDGGDNVKTGFKAVSTNADIQDAVI